ncbi:MAG: porin family protein, partial [Mesorhizobium sp.]|nr:porin family protein [Mesorhizobium sp.]
MAISAHGRGFEADAGDWLTIRELLFNAAVPSRPVHRLATALNWRFLDGPRTRRKCDSVLSQNRVLSLAIFLNQHSGGSMRRLTLASACFLVTAASPVLAADVTAGPSMTSPGFDWTGYYAGLQAGYGWGQADINGTSGPPFSTSSDPAGGFVGGYVGGLWQFNQAVLGAEAELNYASIGGSSSLGAGNSFGSDVRWFGSIDAKAGFAMDRVLIYGVGGRAFAGIET